MNKPKVSVITVCYNAADTLERTILSVINQKYDNLEYIIIDGNSQDETLSIIHKYAHRISKWKSEPDKGIYDAMNKGVFSATGEWIIFRNSGDVFFNEHSIEIVFEKYIDGGEDFIVCKCRCEKLGLYYEATPNLGTFSIYEGMPFSHPSTFIRRSTQLKYPFNISYRNSADYCFFLDALLHGATYKYLNETIAIMDCETGTSVDNSVRSLTEDLVILMEFNSPHRYISKLKKKLKLKRFVNKIKKIIPFYTSLQKRYLLRRGWKRII